jgi:hypothetical protein
MGGNMKKLLALLVLLAAPAFAQINIGNGGAVNIGSGSGGGGIPYPGAGIACSTGSAWCSAYSAGNQIPSSYLNLSAYLTTTSAASTYQPISSMSGYALLAGANFTGPVSLYGKQLSAPLHVNASTVPGFVSDGATDVTSVIQGWLTSNPNQILDIPWDGVTGHCALVSAPLQISSADAGIWGSGKNVRGSGGICTKTPNISLINPYNTGAYPGSISVHNLNLSYVGTLASGAAATATISTGAGAAVTSYTVTAGGTYYAANTSVYVNGCANTQGLETFSGGTITAISPATGSPAQGTLVTAASTGNCIDITNTANQWQSGAAYAKYHAIVVNVSGTNYIYAAAQPIASAATQPSCTTFGCTSTDGSGTWTNGGVFGTVVLLGGTTGDSTGEATTGWAIDASGIFGYNEAYLDVDNVSSWDMGGLIRVNGASINRIYNASGSYNQDGNGYCYESTGSAQQSNRLWGVSCTTSAGWSGYLSGQGDSYVMGDMGGATGGNYGVQKGYEINGLLLSADFGNNELIAGYFLLMDGNSSLNVTGGYMMRTTPSVVSNIAFAGSGTLHYNAAGFGRVGDDYGIPMVTQLSGHPNVSASGFIQTAGLPDLGARQLVDENGVQSAIGPLEVNDSFVTPTATSSTVNSLVWQNPATVGAMGHLWAMYYGTGGALTTTDILPILNSPSSGTVSPGFSYGPCVYGNSTSTTCGPVQAATGLAALGINTTDVTASANLHVNGVGTATSSANVNSSYFIVQGYAWNPNLGTPASNYLAIDCRLLVLGLTGSPTATYNCQPSVQTASPPLTPNWAWAFNGHINMTSTTAPTASSCGSGTAAGNDNAFQVTGISAATSCTVTFTFPLQEGYCTANGAVGLVTEPTGTHKSSIVFGILSTETTITAHCF